MNIDTVDECVKHACYKLTQFAVVYILLCKAPVNYIKFHESAVSITNCSRFRIIFYVFVVQKFDYMYDFMHLLHVQPCISPNILHVKAKEV